MNADIHIILGGDTMLGRLVKDEILTQGYRYPMGAIAEIMRGGDLTLVNLECAVTDSNHHWPGEPKAFYFGAPSDAIHSLVDCGIDLVALANNHSLDFDVQGLQDTLQHLAENNIAQAGAGKNLNEALAPGIVERKGMRFGMVAFCDHQADFAAESDRPGMAYLDLHKELHALENFEAGLKQLQAANVDWPILSLHWGPNMVHRPSAYFVKLAHAAIDMGYKMLFGHSAHVFHGIEFYKGYPIIYAAGDLVDDYYVDPEFKNDHQLLFEIVINHDRVKEIFLYPIFIELCQVGLATGAQFNFIADRAKNLCQEMGTVVEDYDKHRLIVKG